MLEGFKVEESSPVVYVSGEEVSYGWLLQSLQFLWPNPIPVTYNLI